MPLPKPSEDKLEFLNKLPNAQPVEKKVDAADKPVLPKPETVKKTEVQKAEVKSTEVVEDKKETVAEEKTSKVKKEKVKKPAKTYSSDDLMASYLAEEDENKKLGYKTIALIGAAIFLFIFFLFALFNFKVIPWSTNVHGPDDLNTTAGQHSQAGSQTTPVKSDENDESGDDVVEPSDDEAAEPEVQERINVTSIPRQVPEFARKSSYTKAMKDPAQHRADIIQYRHEVASGPTGDTGIYIDTNSIGSESAGFTSDPAQLYVDGGINMKFTAFTQEDYIFFLETSIQRLLNPAYGGWNQSNKAAKLDDLFTDEFKKSPNFSVYTNEDDSVGWSLAETINFDNYNMDTQTYNPVVEVTFRTNKTPKKQTLVMELVPVALSNGTNVLKINNLYVK